MELKIDGAQVEGGVGGLGLELQVDALVGLDADRQGVGRDVAAGALGEDQVRRAAELDQDLGLLAAEGLPGAQVEGHALPAPVVYVQAQGRVCSGTGVGGDAGLVEVAFVLALDGEDRSVAGLYAPDGPHYLDLLVAQGVGFEGGRRLHGNDGEKLEQVALEHVAEDAGPVVVGGALGD